METRIGHFLIGYVDPGKNPVCCYKLPANIDEECELIVNCYLSRSIAVIGKKFEAVADSKETWYGTAYKMEKIDLKDIETWENAGLSEKLHMPHRNEFIPEKLDLVPREEVAKRFSMLFFTCSLH